MPKRKYGGGPTRSAKRSRKRVFLKAKRMVRRQARRVMHSSLAPFAPRYITKLKYCETINFSPGLQSQDYLFRLNSIFDPNQSGTGHQPMGHDQIAPLYSRYRVFRCKWSLVWTSELAAGSTVTVVPTNEATTLHTNVDAARELPYAQFKSCHVGSPPIKMNGNVSLPRLNGKTNVQYKTDDKTGALIGASPSEILMLHVIPASADYTANITGSLTIMLKFYCEFFDPVQLGSS